MDVHVQVVEALSLHERVLAKDSLGILKETASLHDNALRKKEEKKHEARLMNHSTVDNTQVSLSSGKSGSLIVHEIFTSKIIRVKNFCVDRFSLFV